jgi:excinuclease ABC subunit A
MPWKVNGERWHLSEKGFPPGKKVKWDRRALPKLLELVQGVAKNIIVKWDVRDRISLRAGDDGPIIAYWWTKLADTLDCRFVVPKGVFNLSRVEGLAGTVSIRQEKAGEDVIDLYFTSLEQIDGKKLSSFVKEVLAAS